MDPGLTESAIRIGTIQPSEGRLGEIGRAIKKILLAYFENINEKGGIYGRKLELVVKERPGTITKSAICEGLENNDLFALLSTFTPAQR